MSSSQVEKKTTKNVSAASIVCSDPNLVSTLLGRLPKWEHRMSLRAVNTVWCYAADLYECWQEADLRWLDHTIQNKDKYKCNKEQKEKGKVKEKETQKEKEKEKEETETQKEKQKHKNKNVVMTKHVALTPYRLAALRVLTVSNPPLGMKHLLQAIDKCKEAGLESLTVFLRNNTSKMIIYRASPSVVRLGVEATSRNSSSERQHYTTDSGLNRLNTLHVEFPLSISDVKFLIGRTPELKVLILTSLVPFYRFSKDCNTRRERLPAAHRMPEFINSWKHQEWMRRYLYAHLAKLCGSVKHNSIEAVQVDLFPMVQTRDFAQTLNTMTNCDICVGADETAKLLKGRDMASVSQANETQSEGSYDDGPNASWSTDECNAIIPNVDPLSTFRQEIDLSEEADELIDTIIASHSESLKCLHSSDLYVSLEVVQRLRKECTLLNSWSLPGWRLIFPQLEENK